MQHPSAEDTDYASYLADSGEAEAGEGNRTREPTAKELQEGDVLEQPWSPATKNYTENERKQDDGMQWNENERKQDDGMQWNENERKQDDGMRWNENEQKQDDRMQLYANETKQGEEAQQVEYEMGGGNMYEAPWDCLLYTSPSPRDRG